MSEQNPTGSGRPERGPVTELARLFLVQLAAVIGIATAIVVVVALVGPDGDDDVTAGTPTRSSTGTDTKETPAPSATSSAPAPAPSTPSSSSVPAPSPSTSASVDTGVAAAVAVDVLNQSAPGGSAEQLAQRLEDAGWEIGRVDDFHGNVSTTTVYWLDPEQQRQARQVSRFLGGVRVQEGFDTLVDGRISVVLVEAP